MILPKVSLAEAALERKPMQHAWFRGTAQYYISTRIPLRCERYAIQWKCCRCMAGKRVRMRLAIANSNGETIPFRIAHVSFPGNALKVRARDEANIHWLFYSGRFPEKVSLKSTCLSLDAQGLLIYVARTTQRARWPNVALRVAEGAMKTDFAQEFVAGSDDEVVSLEFYQHHSSSTVCEPR
eukprot:TRINITY_DN67434_c0_g1_i1.p1 TRINITY_DN67434_c0_g1~~TRINITY_DN67434_c0_g1_i1.p1  ORF type:complete len:212 (-),score=8.68 TRINITY_DN67434_c0_g1_i1:134-679(-)